MKALKFTVLLYLVITYTSCKDTKFLDCCIDIDGYDHNMYLSFQDSSGNDLVKGIGFYARDSEIGEYVTGKEEDESGWVNNDLFYLEYVYPDEIQNIWKSERGSVYDYPKEIYLVKGKKVAETYPEFGNYDRLFFTTGSPKMYHTSSGKFIEVPFAEKIIFRFTCPYVFGDNKAHDIVTWWKPHDNKNASRALCYQIEFEGKEYTPITYNSSAISFATIILNR